MKSSFTISVLGLLLCCAFSSLVSANTIKAAPYFMPLDNDPQNIDDIVANSGIRHFIFAFALATNQGECLPVWDGNKGQPIAEDTKVLDMVNKVRKHGGDISISFGGYNGVEMGLACKSVEQLAKSYQTVIDKYQLTHVDFDIEGNALGAADSETRRFEAIKILKQNAKAKGKELHVTLTLPCTTVGLSGLGKDEIKRAIAVDPKLIDLYKIMAFDYGGPAASMSDNVVHVMEQVHAQLKSMRTDLTTDEQVYSHTGMILMNGHTDQPTELFTLDTFSKLLEYAQTKKLGRLSYWSLNRDRPCPAGKTLGWAAGICSSLPQQPWEFTKIIAKFDPSNANPGSHQTSKPDPHVTQPVTHESTVPVTHPPTPAKPTSPPVQVDCTNTHGEQYFPFANDCHKYIRCFGGQQHVETCPAGLIYDLKLHICNWEHDVDRPECKH